MKITDTVIIGVTCCCVVFLEFDTFWASSLFQYKSTSEGGDRERPKYLRSIYTAAAPPPIGTRNPYHHISVLLFALAVRTSRLVVWQSIAYSVRSSGARFRPPALRRPRLGRDREGRPEHVISPGAFAVSAPCDFFSVYTVPRHGSLLRSGIHAARC